MKHAITLALAGAVTLGTVGLGGAAYADPPAPARATVGQVHIVQAVPNDRVSVTVDGKRVGSRAASGDVLGPFDLSPGSHTIGFTSAGGGTATTSTLEVTAGSNNDVVLHRPAAVGGDPVVSSYSTPMKPIGPGKSRVLVAHTATVAPADVRVDGQVVFRNIANGEFATADVASGRHSVALLPTGVAGPPLLGPLEVTLEPRTVTMVYAVGNPQDESMEIIAHVVSLKADGSVAPDSIDTGSAGLAGAIDVRPFTGGSEPARGPSSLVGLLAAVAAAAMVPIVMVGRRRARGTSRA